MKQVSLEIIIILLLILVNGFFALSEIALVAARKSKIRQLAKKGNKKAQIAQKLQEDPNRFLATVQIGITLVGTLAGVIGGARIVAVLTPAIAKIPIHWVQKSAEEIAIGIVVISISYLSLLIGELFPKYFAVLHSEKVALKIAGPVNLLSKIAGVLLKILTIPSQALVNLFGGKEPIEKIYTASEDEIKLLVQEAREISELLKEFQRQRTHMAIVKDSSGKTVGLVTMEDLIEEIVGEIQDEHDIERAKEVDYLLDGTALVNASMRIDDFNQTFQAQLPLKDGETLGSLITNKLGRVPALDETVQLYGFNFTVHEKLGHRQQRLKVSKV